jgi:hypothetical protein
MTNWINKYSLVAAAIWVTWGSRTAAQIDRTPPNVGATSQSTTKVATSVSSVLDGTPTNVLTPDVWKRVDLAVDRALTWLAAQQQDDGSFPTLDTGQPGVTSLCILAYISHGHTPGEGPYGPRLEKATEFVLSCQRENGLVAKMAVDSPEIFRGVDANAGTTTAYDHAISSLMLSELYGMSEQHRAHRMEAAIKKALTATLTMQQWPKELEADRGGWRYIDDRDQSDSDLSVTGWNLMFLRSARNAGFDVPKQAIDDAVAYIRRCYTRKYGTFEYWINRPDGRTRAMGGAGVLALAHAGYHNSIEAQSAGAWVLNQPFEPYNGIRQNPDTRVIDRYHYSVFTCCQAMYQLGDKYWRAFFPRIVPVLLANQQPDGSWPADSYKTDGKFGNTYTTALMVMTLGAPNQLIPIFQR